MPVLPPTEESTCEKRGRHLDEVHTTLVAGGRESRHVADDAAAQRHDRCIAIVPSTEQCVENKLKRLPILVAFAIRQDYGGNGIAGKRARQTIEVQWRNRFIGHDGDLAAANLACKRSLRSINRSPI